MASSNGTRWRIACDRCDAAVWTGPEGDRVVAWCEACQVAHVREASGRCPVCAGALVVEPRFVELWGGLQQLDAVLAAYLGSSAT